MLFDFLFLGSIRCSVLTGALVLALLFPGASSAQTWTTNPGSADWNTAANWSPASVPNSNTASATLNLSSVTNLTLSADVNLGSIVELNSLGVDFDIATNGHSLNFWGTGLGLDLGGTLAIQGTGLVGFHNSAGAGSTTFIADSGGQFVFNDSSSGGDSSFTVNAGAQFDISPLTTSGMAVGSIDGAGNFYLGSKALTVTKGGGTVTGVISDGGADGGTGAVLCVNGGSVTLLGDNTYTGGTSILGQVAVGNPNALGTGSVYNGGILSSDGNPTTIRIQGNYDQGSFADLFIGLGGVGAGQYDRVEVAGAATILGSFDFNTTNGYQPQVGDTFTLLTASSIDYQPSFGDVGSLPGTFTLTRPRLESFPTSVILQVIPASFAQYALTPNQASFSGELDKIYQEKNLNEFITNLIALPISNYPSVYDQASPVGWTSLYRSGFQELNEMAAEAKGRLDYLRGEADRFSTEGFFDPKFGPPQSPSADDPRGSSLAGDETSAHIRGDSNAAGYDFTLKEISLGEVEYRFAKDVVAGTFLTYGHMDLTLGSGGGGQMDGGMGGIYATWFGGGWHMDAMLAVGFNFYQLQRLGFDESLTANPEGMEFTGSLGGGYDFKTGPLTLSPYVSFQPAEVDLINFNESGPFFSSLINEQGEGSCLGECGLRMSCDWKAAGVGLEPNLNLAWRHEYLLTRDKLIVQMGSAFDETYEVQGPLLGQDWILADVGLNLGWDEKTSTYFTYRAELGRFNFDSQSLNCGMIFGF